MSSPDIKLKVAVVGGGISGLATYLFLEKHLSPSVPCQIIIHEAYPSLSRKQRAAAGEEIVIREAATFIGGGFGVAPNGMRVLWELDPEIHDAIVAQGYPSLRFQIKNSHNHTLGSIPTADIYNNRPERLVMTTRQGFWDCLRDKVPEEALRIGKAVLNVGRGPSCRPILEFMDGTTSEEFDLVIGADGMKSAVRNAVSHGEHFEPIYEGRCSVGGFVSSDHLPRLPHDLTLPPPQSPVVMTFGAEGFFGYGPCSSITDSDLEPLKPPHIKENRVVPYGPQMIWWSTYIVDEPPTSTKVVDEDKETIHAQLLKMHSKWKDPVIQKVLANPAVSVMTAKFSTPKLPTWIGDLVVLIGDAAHALSYTSGQGVSQALEDAETLALLLAHYLQNPPISASNQESLSPPIGRRIQAAITTFQAIRKPRVERIMDSSRQAGNETKKMGPVREWITYFFIWLTCKIYAVFPRLLNRTMGRWDAAAAIRKVVHGQKEKRA